MVVGRGEAGWPVQHRMSAFGSARVVATPSRTCRTGLSGHGGSPPPWLDSLLNCSIAPAVQRIGRSVCSGRPASDLARARSARSARDQAERPRVAWPSRTADPARPSRLFPPRSVTMLVGRLRAGQRAPIAASLPSPDFRTAAPPGTGTGPASRPETRFPSLSNEPLSACLYRLIPAIVGHNHQCTRQFSA